MARRGLIYCLFEYQNENKNEIEKRAVLLTFFASYFVEGALDETNTNSLSQSRSLP